MDENDVPPLFLCPISLQLMRDPVTVCTGITYDRENIEKWLSSCKNYTCPVTKQPLSQHTDLTPNHTLQRLIQAWCSHSACLGIENVPTPKPTIDKTQILKLISEAKRFPEKQLKCLKSLQSIALESESNKLCLVSSGVILIDFLASIMLSCISQEDSPLKSEVAIEVLFHLNPCGAQLKNLINNEGTIQLIEALFQVLRHGNYKSRSYATMLLKSAFEVAGPTQSSSVRTELFVEITRFLKDQVSNQGSKAALKLLVELCSWGRNRIKAVEGGSVLVLIELLFEVSERRSCELMLAALDKLCDCAEGRAEFLSHGAGLAIVSKKILWVSHVASDRGVRILSSICRYSATTKVLQEMLQFGVVSKLCLVVQVESSFKAMETLKLHSGVWKNSPCIPLPLLSFHP
ncbi:E3 ubiquitin-protein ligase PUB23-like [Lotus japonicus]|uniref:E3 ubiquitin-protein ligase PUB23-like n=1 Tax=Lotus japonicus TaxID=34305 RepID=UPI002583F582|nr:E3 ubiquitin-protein ligase PUB23-like [Lotus japonicus]